MPEAGNPGGDGGANPAAGLKTSTLGGATRHHAMRWRHDRLWRKPRGGGGWATQISLDKGHHMHPSLADGVGVHCFYVPVLRKDAPRRYHDVYFGHLF